MAVPIAKKKKNPKDERKQMDNRDVIFSAVCVVISVVLVFFYQEKGWRKKRMDYLVEAIAAIMQEFADGRMYMLDYIVYCKALTGYDVVAKLNSIAANGERYRKKHKNPKTFSFYDTKKVEEVQNGEF